LSARSLAAAFDSVVVRLDRAIQETPTPAITGESVRR
jgi:hypothetical protein